MHIILNQVCVNRKWVKACCPRYSGCDSEILPGTWLVLNLESSPFHRLIPAWLTFITEHYAIQLKWVMSILHCELQQDKIAELFSTHVKECNVQILKCTIRTIKLYTHQPVCFFKSRQKPVNSMHFITSKCLYINM